jgi:hypothetical protein
VVEQWVVEVEGWKAGFLALRRSRHYADTNGKCSLPLAYTIMPSQHNVQLSYTESTLQLAIQATIEDRDESKRHVVAAFSVPRTTVC